MNEALNELISYMFRSFDACCISVGKGDDVNIVGELDFLYSCLCPAKKLISAITHSDKRQMLTAVRYFAFFFKVFQILFYNSNLT